MVPVTQPDSDGDLTKATPSAQGGRPCRTPSSKVTFQAVRAQQHTHFTKAQWHYFERSLRGPAEHWRKRYCPGLVQNYRWFLAAAKIDIANGMNWGTLAYLPVEVRSIIWQMVFDSELNAKPSVQDSSPSRPRWKTYWPDYQPSWVSRSLPNGRGNVLAFIKAPPISPQHYVIFPSSWWKASRDVERDYKSTILSTRIFSCKSACHLQCFLDCIKGFEWSLRGINIAELKSRRCAHRTWKEGANNRCRRKWQKVIQGLPPNLRLVSFQLNYQVHTTFIELETSRTDPERQDVPDLRTHMQETVRRICPKASIFLLY